MQAPGHEVNQTHFPPTRSRDPQSWEQGKAGCMLKMQPTRIVLELDITDILFTGLMCLAVLFVLAWLIFL